MFTCFHLFRLVAAFEGAAVLGGFGWENFGFFGCAVGIPAGLMLGGLIGQLPLLIVLKILRLKFGRMSDDELVSELRDPKCLTPNVHLLELNRRGHDIQQELPYIHSLLASQDIDRRTTGWAALTSAFPELVERVPDYSPTAPASECRQRCMPLLNTTEPSDEPKTQSRGS